MENTNIVTKNTFLTKLLSNSISTQVDVVSKDGYLVAIADQASTYLPLVLQADNNHLIITPYDELDHTDELAKIFDADFTDSDEEECFKFSIESLEKLFDADYSEMELLTQIVEILMNFEEAFDSPEEDIIEMLLALQDEYASLEYILNALAMLPRNSMVSLVDTFLEEDTVAFIHKFKKLQC